MSQDLQVTKLSVGWVYYKLKGLITWGQLDWLAGLVQLAGSLAPLENTPKINFVITGKISARLTRIPLHCMAILGSHLARPKIFHSHVRRATPATWVNTFSSPNFASEQNGSPEFLIWFEFLIWIWIWIWIFRIWISVSIFINLCFSHWCKFLISV